MNNDTNISFVLDKWINGRELLTIYIENGESIYLSVFFKNATKGDKKSANYVFKYINSAKNSNFKSYIVNNDDLEYNQEEKTISINKIQLISSSSRTAYYLKVINQDDYFRKDILNTIAITESKNALTIKGENKGNHIIFHLSNLLNNEKKYHLNAYSIVTENNYDIEFISYSGLIINKKIRDSFKALIVLSLVFS